MESRTVTLKLPEGNFDTTVSVFDNRDDAASLKVIYESWLTLSKKLKEMDSRAVNLPEGLSEIAFSLAKGVWRCTKNITGANSSFDCYNPNSERGSNRIQVKACSVLPDLTSFGPNSQWDKIFFLDFYRQGRWNGKFDIYEISTDDVENYKVNESQTLREQKAQGRRPRFSIYNGLIVKGKYKSKETFQITEEGVLRI